MRIDLTDPALRRFMQEEWLPGHEAAMLSVVAELPARVAEAREKHPGEELYAALDIDEVLLCNVHQSSWAPSEPDDLSPPFSAQSLFPHWAPPDVATWGADAAEWGPPLPGAKELVAALHRANVQIALVTGRRESLREVTIANLKEVGLYIRYKPSGSPMNCNKCYPSDFIPKGDETAFWSPELYKLYMCPDRDLPREGESIAPFKASCREEIAKKGRIVLQVGDQESDLGGPCEWQVLVPHPFYRTP